MTPTHAQLEQKAEAEKAKADQAAAEAAVASAEAAKNTLLEKQAASELLGIVLTSEVASPWDITVAEVQAGSPAERGGLKVGDKVAEINGEPAHLGATA